MSIKKLAKNILNKGQTYVYHKEHNDYARNVLKIVESEKGRLNPKDFKLCKAYANDVFGDEIYAPWLYVYTAFAQEFKEGWIPDNFYGEIVVPTLKGDYGQICNRNVVIGKLVKESASLDICYYVNHLFVNTQSEVLNEKSLRKILFTNNDKVVYKVEDSFQGKGIYFFDEQSFNIETIKHLGNGVFQNYIAQHPFFSEFNDTSVATIRLTSTSNDIGDISIKAGFLKFGRKKDSHVKTATALKIPINVSNGKLYDDAYLPNWSSIKELPDSMILFAGKTLPSFESCKSEVKRMHGNIPYIRCIGWDLIIDINNEVKVIELNGGHNGIRFHEMVQGPCFKGLGWEKLIK